MTKYYNGQLNIVDDNGNNTVIYPITKASNIHVTKTVYCYGSSTVVLQEALNNMVTAINGKAPLSHGEHVPTPIATSPDAALHPKWLRNDNSWQVITAETIGAADRSHQENNLIHLHDVDVTYTPGTGTIKLLSKNNEWVDVDYSTVGAAPKSHSDDAGNTNPTMHLHTVKSESDLAGANNFLRQDNKWVTITPSLIKAAEELMNNALLRNDGDDTYRTMQKTIYTPANDSMGIMPKTNGKGTVGSSSNVYKTAYFKTYYRQVGNSNTFEDINDTYLRRDGGTMTGNIEFDMGDEVIGLLTNQDSHCTIGKSDKAFKSAYVYNIYGLNEIYEGGTAEGNKLSAKYAPISVVATANNALQRSGTDGQRTMNDNLLILSGKSILPATGGTTGTIGTQTNPFKSVSGETIYENGTELNNRYLRKDGENKISGDIQFETSEGTGHGSLTLYPQKNNDASLGTSTLQFSYVYAQNFIENGQSLVNKYAPLNHTTNGNVHVPSHGNTFDGKTFLGNNNTWQVVIPESIGAATAAQGTKADNALLRSSTDDSFRTMTDTLYLSSSANLIPTYSSENPAPSIGNTRHVFSSGHFMTVYENGSSLESKYFKSTGGTMNGSITLNAGGLYRTANNTDAWVGSQAYPFKNIYSENFYLCGGGNAQSLTSIFASSVQGSKADNSLQRSAGSNESSRTMENDIITPDDDSKGIRPKTNNKGTIGTSNYSYRFGFINILYTDYISIHNTSATSQIGDFEHPFKKIYASELVANMITPTDSSSGNNIGTENKKYDNAYIETINSTNVYGTTIYENGTPLINKYSPTGHDHGDYYLKSTGQITYGAVSPDDNMTNLFKFYDKTTLLPAGDRCQVFLGWNPYDNSSLNPNSNDFQSKMNTKTKYSFEKVSTRDLYVMSDLYYKYNGNWTEMSTILSNLDNRYLKINTDDTKTSNLKITKEFSVVTDKCGFGVDSNESFSYKVGNTTYIEDLNPGLVSICTNNSSKYALYIKTVNIRSPHTIYIDTMGCAKILKITQSSNSADCSEPPISMDIYQNLESSTNNGNTVYISHSVIDIKNNGSDPGCIKITNSNDSHNGHPLLIENNAKSYSYGCFVENLNSSNTSTVIYAKGCNVSGNNSVIYAETGTAGNTKIGLATDGLVKGFSFQNNSSKLIKTNITEITDDEAKKLLNANPVHFDYKEECGGAKNNIGLIAEEFSKIIPEAVCIPQEFDESKFDLSKGLNQVIPSIDYSKITPHLIKLCQVQQKQIDALEKRIAALENK